MIGFLALVAASLIPAADRSTQPYASAGHWDIYENEKSCAAIDAYDAERSAIFIEYYGDAVDAVVGVLRPSNEYLDAGKTYQMEIAFVSGKEVKRRPITTTMSEGELGRTIVFRINGKEFLDELAANEMFVVIHDQDFVGKFILDAVPEAVASLRKCVAEATGDRKR